MTLRLYAAALMISAMASVVWAPAAFVFAGLVVGVVLAIALTGGSE